MLVANYPVAYLIMLLYQHQYQLSVATAQLLTLGMPMTRGNARTRRHMACYDLL